MEVLRTAILDLCRRKKGKSFHPSEVVRQMFPEDWELFLPDLHTELIAMQQEKLIQISHIPLGTNAMENPALRICVSIDAN